MLSFELRLQSKIRYFTCKSICRWGGQIGAIFWIHSYEKTLIKLM